MCKETIKYPQAIEAEACRTLLVAELTSSTERAISPMLRLTEDTL
jgi:hypothetical protein